MNRAVRLLGMLTAVGTGCADGPPPEADTWPVVIVSIADLDAVALDTLARAETAVSITGRVVRQDDAGVQLTDGTGVVWIYLPEPLPLLEEQRLLVRGAVVPASGAPAVWALEWAYDDEAPARSGSEATPSAER